MLAKQITYETIQSSIMLDFIRHNEIVDSINGAVEDRLTSHLYGVFIISWLTLHWELIYTAFFVSEDKIWVKYHLLRNEYLRQRFFDFHSWTIHCLWFWLNMLVPFGVTYLVIWVFPKRLILPAFKKHEEDRTERRKIILVEKRKIAQAEQRLEEESEKRLKTRQRRVQTQKTIRETDPEVLWDEEYSTFKDSSLYNSFDEVIEAIYEHNGSTKVFTTPPFEVGMDILVYCHSNGLIKYKVTPANRIEFTEKGLYFVKKYSADGQV